MTLTWRAERQRAGQAAVGVRRGAGARAVRRLSDVGASPRRVDEVGRALAACGVRLDPWMNGRRGRRRPGPRSARREGRQRGDRGDDCYGYPRVSEHAGALPDSAQNKAQPSRPHRGARSNTSSHAVREAAPAPRRASMLSRTYSSTSGSPQRRTTSSAYVRAQLLGQLLEVVAQAHRPGELHRVVRRDRPGLEPAAHLVEAGRAQARLGLLRRGVVPGPAEVGHVLGERRLGGDLVGQAPERVDVALAPALRDQQPARPERGGEPLEQRARGRRSSGTRRSRRPRRPARRARAR